MLEKPEIVIYLERNRPLTHASKREKLSETLREHGDNLQELVTNYNLQNPPPPQQRQQEVPLYGAQRRRANLPKKDTKGRVLFGPEPPPRAPRRPRGSVIINGENLTAIQAFNRYPQLFGHYQSERRLAEGTLHAKIRKDSRNGNIPYHILNEDPPQFRQVNNHFNGAQTRYKLDDPRIKFHNIPSLFEYLKPQIIELIQTHPNTKVGLSVHVWMINRTAGALQKRKKGLHTGINFENFRGTNPESVFDSLREIIYEELQKLEDVEGSGWALVSVIHVNMTFAKISPIGRIEL